MQALNLKVFPGPAAFLAEESGHLHELASMANGLQPVLFRYSNNFPVDLQMLQATISNSGIKDVAVVLTASTSSDLWLDEEHGPTTVRICQHLQSQQGVQLHFIVKPTTSDAKRRWIPGQDVPHIFRGYLRHEGQHLLVWDTSKRPDPVVGCDTTHQNGPPPIDLTVRVDAGLTLSNRNQSLPQQALAWFRSHFPWKAVCCVGALAILSFMARKVLVLNKRLDELSTKVESLSKKVEVIEGVHTQAEILKKQDESSTKLVEAFKDPVAAIKSVMPAAIARLWTQSKESGMAGNAEETAAGNKSNTVSDMESGTEGNAKEAAMCNKSNTVSGMEARTEDSAKEPGRPQR